MEAEIGTRLTPEQAIAYENIVKMREQGMKFADKRCRKKRMGAVPFSAELRQKQDVLEMWKAIETKKSGCVYSWTKLRWLINKTRIRDPMSLSLEEAKQKVKEAYKAYYNVKKKATRL